MNTPSIFKRLLSSNRKEPSFFWYKFLGFKPNDVSLYEKALKHRSAHPNMDENNERMEFLGDAILHAIVSEHLFKAQNQADEGKMTQLRADIENRKNLNAIAHAMGLDTQIQTKTDVSGTDIAGNALEALIGAIYLDKGMDTCKKFVFKNIINKKANRNNTQESKQKLVQWCSIHNCTFAFVMVKNEVTSDNKHHFLVAVHVNEKEIAQAAGNTKKEAEQLAANRALKILNKHSNQLI